MKTCNVEKCSIMFAVLNSDIKKQHYMQHDSK